MTNKEAIKFLKQLYPNGGHCWLDEQRIEAIGMAVKALQEEPVSKEIGDYDHKAVMEALHPELKEEPVSEDLEKTIDTFLATYFGSEKEKQEWPFLKKMAIYFANWQKERLWKSAEGPDLPIFDREVIVLVKYSTQRNIHDEEYPTYRVGFGHRPDPKGWDGKSVTTGKVEHYTPKTYDKGGWNIPNIVYWLDVKLPKEIEL